MDRHMKLLTLEKESSLGSLWDQEQCEQFCSKDELWEAAKKEEMKIPWKEAQEGLPVLEDQYQERFWRRRLDGIGLDDDDPFIVLTETKFSFRCIPVWIGTLLTGLGSKKNTCDNVLTMTSTVPW